MAGADRKGNRELNKHWFQVRSAEERHNLEDDLHRQKSTLSAIPVNYEELWCKQHEITDQPCLVTACLACHKTQISQT